MALNIKSDEADRLARELASVTGESLIKAVTLALEERLLRERRRSANARRLRDVRLQAIYDRAASIPCRDPRPVDEILDYNEHGTFD